MDGSAGFEPAAGRLEGACSSVRAATQGLSESGKKKNPGDGRRGSVDRVWLGQAIHPEFPARMGMASVARRLPAFNLPATTHHDPMARVCSRSAVLRAVGLEWAQNIEGDLAGVEKVNEGGWRWFTRNRYAVLA